MRVLIVGVGTRGDVAPYTGLGVRLREAGHEVTIAAHKPYAELVTGAGLGFVSLPGDPLPALTGPFSVRLRSFEEYGEHLVEGLAALAGREADLLLLGMAGPGDRPPGRLGGGRRPPASRRVRGPAVRPGARLPEAVAVRPPRGRDRICRS
ncbi:glycosyltransferase [Streptosporangium sp. NPDC048865]|uniref:glycosyltransferase n=1 Tax=Streptosporangium sp. NPDC048865 TaxID=3155766 RepID=UPI00343B88E5